MNNKDNEWAPSSTFTLPHTYCTYCRREGRVIFMVIFYLFLYSSHCLAIPISTLDLSLFYASFSPHFLFAPVTLSLNLFLPPPPLSLFLSSSHPLCVSLVGNCITSQDLSMIQSGLSDVHFIQSFQTGGGGHR